MTRTLNSRAHSRIFVNSSKNWEFFYILKHLLNFYLGLESKGKTPAENSENENKNVHNKEKMKGKMVAEGEPKVCFLRINLNFLNIFCKKFFFELLGWSEWKLTKA